MRWTLQEYSLRVSKTPSFWFQLPHWSPLPQHTTSDYCARVLIPLLCQTVSCIMLRDRWWKTGTPNTIWGGETKSLKHKQQLSEFADKQTPGGSDPLRFASSACHRPRSENIPFLLASLVGMKLKIRLFLELRCVCVLISHQWWRLQHLLLFFLAQDAQPASFGSHTLQIPGANFLAAWLMWLCNGFRHFEMSKTDYCIHKQLLWRYAHTGWFLGSKNGSCVMWLV